MTRDTTLRNLYIYITFMFAFCVTAHESIPMYTYFSKNVSMYLQIYTLKYILKLTYYIKEASVSRQKDSCFKKKRKSTQPLVQIINVTIWTPWCKHWELIW